MKTSEELREALDRSERQLDQIEGMNRVEFTLQVQQCRAAWATAEALTDLRDELVILQTAFTELLRSIISQSEKKIGRPRK